MSKEFLRALPAMDRLLASPLAEQLGTDLSRDRVRELLREILEQLRAELMARDQGVAGGSGAETREATGADDLMAEIERRLQNRAAALLAPSLRRVINATGVVIHTNLGRAPLARDAARSVSEITTHYSNLEYDLDKGLRGRRETHCQELLSRLTGAESAVLANNNAAAVLLVLNTLAEGGEVIVSRGELVEIGGSFRIPEVMQKSGAGLREVGTTNRTRISDYQDAINESTRLILRVHPSNYRIIGFTERPSVREVAELATRAGVPSFEDLGSGCLIDLSRYGIEDEPVVAESLEAGISVVSFSGDKLLGGPQAGIIAGERKIVDRVRRNPLMRALRVDKMTYAAMEVTLRAYERGLATSEVPVMRAIAMDAADIAERAARFVERLTLLAAGSLHVALEDGESVIGGGSAPEVKLPTVLVSVQHAETSAAHLEEQLRQGLIPIITRTERDRILIDLRTVAADEESVIVDALAEAARGNPKAASA